MDIAARPASRVAEFIMHALTRSLGSCRGQHVRTWGKLRSVSPAMSPQERYAHILQQFA